MAAFRVLGKPILVWRGVSVDYCWKLRQVRALLINSARSIGGTVEIYSYQARPPCPADTGICPPWVQVSCGKLAHTTSTQYEGVLVTDLDGRGGAVCFGGSLHQQLRL